MPLVTAHYAGAMLYWHHLRVWAERTNTVPFSFRFLTVILYTVMLQFGPPQHRCLSVILVSEYCHPKQNVTSYKCSNSGSQLERAQCTTLGASLSDIDSGIQMLTRQFVRYRGRSPEPTADSTNYNLFEFPTSHPFQPFLEFSIVRVAELALCRVADVLCTCYTVYIYMSKIQVYNPPSQHWF